MNHPSKKQHTKRYNTIAVRADDDDTVIPLVTHPPNLSRTNDDNGGKTKKRDRGPIIVATILLLVFGLSLYAGGPFDFDGGSLRPCGGNLVDGTATSVVQASAKAEGEEYDLDFSKCVLPTNTFKGFSKTTYWGYNDPFQTCYHLGRDKKRKDEANCCWTNSYYRADASFSEWFQCVPDGLYGANYWHASYDSHPVTCGLPCQNMYKDENTGI